MQLFTFPDINPIILSFGPFAISWYSLSYVTGVLVGLVLIKKIVNKLGLDISSQNLDDFVTWAIIGIIVGGRLGYVLLYDPVKYLSHPIDILKTYKGGMSFHGGILGLSIAAYFFCLKHQIKFLILTDLLSIVAPIGIFLGRIANFINAEVYGRVTDVPWAIIFPGSDMQLRHPSQLYEAFLEGFVLFVVLQYLLWRSKLINRTGVFSAIFLILYSLFRIIVENLREPDFQIGFVLRYITMGQILSIPMLVIGIYLLRKS